MLNTVYRLVSPRQFEVHFPDITIDQEHVLVRPTHLSICNADQRYYQGLRPEAVLKEKLPMALIHEAIGKVIYDPTGTFQVGDRVVMVPNVPADVAGTQEADASNNGTNVPAAGNKRGQVSDTCLEEPVAENYRRDSKFRGSSIDGFMQEMVQTTPDRLVKLPDALDNDLVAAFTEMASVCYHAISRFDTIAHSKRDVIGVWGDGNMGYFTSLLLKQRFPESKVLIFGRQWAKMNDFSFVDGAYSTAEVPADLMVDHAFECVGGAGCAPVIDQIIDHINPEGTLSLLGVSEEPVPIRTRMVLEKGLRLFGTSRSGREDFEQLLKLYEEKPETIGYLEKMVGGVVEVRGVADITSAFEMDIHKVMGKTIMVWK